MPFNGTGLLTVDPYLIRSQMSPEFTIGVDTRRPDQDYDLLRKLVRQWRQVAPCYLGDYWHPSGMQGLAISVYRWSALRLTTG